MVRILDLYLIRAVLGGVFIVLCVLLALTGFFTFLAELEEVGKGNYTALRAAQYALYYLPGVAYEIFPIVCLLGALLGLGSLASGSELVVMRAAGVSLGRIAISVLLAGAMLGSLCFALGDFLAPVAMQEAKSMRTIAQSGGAARLIGSLWFRDGNRVLHVADAKSAEEAGRVEIFELSGDGTQLESAGRARSAEFVGDKWSLEDWKTSYFEGGRVHLQAADTQLLQTSLTPDLMELFSVDPEDFSSRELARYASYLRSNSLDASAFQQALWTKGAVPFTVALMTLLALPFVLGSLRSTGAGIRLMLGVMVGVVYFLAMRILGNVGQVWDWHPAVAAILPGLVILTITTLGIRRAR